MNLEKSIANTYSYEIYEYIFPCEYYGIFHSNNDYKSEGGNDVLWLDDAYQICEKFKFATLHSHHNLQSTHT